MDDPDPDVPPTNAPDPGAAAAHRTRPGPRGPLRDLVFLLPANLALLALLALIALANQRSALDALLDLRRQEAERLARAVVETLPRQGPVSPGQLQRAAPLARGIAVLGPRGEIVVRAGTFPAQELRAPLAGQTVDRTATYGPDAAGALVDTIAAFAPLEPDRLVRVDLPAPLLGSQAATLERLTAIVAVVGAAGLLLAIAPLRRINRPWEQFLARARSSGALAGSEEDPAALLAVFDRAMTALAQAPRSVEEELARVGGSLAPRLDTGLLLLDSDHRVLAASPAAVALLAIPPPVPGTALATVLAGHPALAAGLGAAASGAAVRSELDWSLGSGEQQQTLGFDLHPLLEAGQRRGTLVLFTDLTVARRAAAEERLAASLAQLGELSAGVAHELRNGLATLFGYAELLREEVSSESGHDYLAELVAEARHLRRVVDDFLSFASPSQLRCGPVDLAHLVTTAAADPNLAAAPIHLGELPPPGIAVVLADRQLLAQALRNLLLNAAAACRKSIALALVRAGDGWELHVDDDGSGLPAAIRDRLFQPFTSSRPDGVGLGLAVAHRLITLHGGRLSLEPLDTGGTRAAVFLGGTSVS